MKKTLLSLLLLTSILRLQAQVTLDHTFTGITSVVLFSGAGEKYMTNDTNSIYLYNMDYSLWKTITPTHYSGYRLTAVSGVSDHLFNADDLVEVVAGYSAWSTGTHPYYKCELFNETGTVLFSFDSSFSGFPHYDAVSSSYKFITVNYTNPPYSSSSYSVPGTMPCGNCSSLGTERLSGTPQVITLGDAIPNPSSGVVRIYYSLPATADHAVLNFYNQLGQLVKNLPVLTQQNMIEINNATLPTGTYLYNLKTDNATSETKTMVIHR